MLSILKNIPNIKKRPLNYVFEDMKLHHNPNTLWLEFGVATGSTINYISQYTNAPVYGFDSFEGLPEDWRDDFKKGAFNRNGYAPSVKENVVLLKGWFNNTLPNFIKEQNKKISFMHIDCDLYSSTKFILDTVKDYINKDCVVVFDELVNYPGFDGERGELRAFYEFINENNVEYEWIGMNGSVGTSGESVAVILHSVQTK